MAGILARFLNSEIARLAAERDALEEDADFWQDRYTEERKLRKDAESTLRAEIDRNKTREDLLLNEALRAAGCNSVPSHEVLKTSDGAVDELDEVPEQLPPGMPNEDEILRSRARLYAEQRHGENPTDEQVEVIYAEMDKDRDHWLSND